VKHTVKRREAQRYLFGRTSAPLWHSISSANVHVVAAEQRTFFVHCDAFLNNSILTVVPVYSALIVMSTDSPEEPVMSKPVFFGGALAIVSGGMFYGFNKVMKEQKITLNMKSHSAPTAVAAKAFLAATLLCFGSVVGGTSIFVAVTGITSFTQFGKSTEKLFARYIENPLTEEAKNDQKNTAGMSCDEEMEYVNKRYFTGLYEDDSEDESETETEIVTDKVEETKP
jgi:hypothetical protein